MLPRFGSLTPSAAGSTSESSSSSSSSESESSSESAPMPMTASSPSSSSSSSLPSDAAPGGVNEGAAEEALDSSKDDMLNTEGRRERGVGEAMAVAAAAPSSGRDRLSCRWRCSSPAGSGGGGDNRCRAHLVHGLSSNPAVLRGLHVHGPAAMVPVAQALVVVVLLGARRAGVITNGTPGHEHTSDRGTNTPLTRWHL
eukprot:m.353195 g.353195  ORF g.353195 m.353195 type:complete len:198 (+) comp19903_c22_seq43:2527-3120(+)